MFALLLRVATAATVHAQASAVKSWKCDFPVVVSASWDGDGAQPKVKTGRQELTFNVDAVNFETHRARMIGNAGSADLRAVDGDDRVTFLEWTATRNLNVVVIYDPQQKDGTFRAVHSRHFSLPGAPGPSQQYGKCRRWE